MENQITMNKALKIISLLLISAISFINCLYLLEVKTPIHLLMGKGKLQTGGHVLSIKEIGIA